MPNQNVMQQTQSFISQPEIFSRTHVVSSDAMTQNGMLPNRGTVVFDLIPGGLVVRPRTDGTGTPSYFLGYNRISEQGTHPEYVDIPKHPAGGGFVFTGSLSGCSVIVTELDDHTYRVFHDARPNSSTLHQRVVMAVDYLDYRLPNDQTGYASVFMHYNEGQWRLVMQRQHLTSNPNGPQLILREGPVENVLTVASPGLHVSDTKLQALESDRANLQQRLLDEAGRYGINVEGVRDGVYEGGGDSSSNPALQKWDQLRAELKNKVHELIGPMKQQLDTRRQARKLASGAVARRLDEQILTQSRAIDYVEKPFLVLLSESNTADRAWLRRQIQAHDGQLAVVDVSNGRLAGGEAAFTWTTASKSPKSVSSEEVSRSVARTVDEDFNYRKQLIVQLNGDDTSFNAAKNLFLKHPQQSEWMQLKPGETPARVGWNGAAVADVTTPFLDADGNVRIVLVGHGTRDADGTVRFGSYTAVELQAQLEEQVFNVLDQQILHRVQGVRLDMVGCELVDRHFAERNLGSTLPGQMADWLVQKTRSMGIDDAHVSVSARQYAVRVNDQGRKEILYQDLARPADPAQWLSKDDVLLRDVAHKVEITLDPQTGKPVLRPQTRELLEFGRDAEQARRDLPADSPEAKSLQALRNRALDQARSQLLDGPAQVGNHGKVAEQAAIERLQTWSLAKKYNDAISTLRRDSTLTQAWVSTCETNETARTIRFINRATGESRWVHSDNEDLFTACRKFNELNGRVAKVVCVDTQGRVQLRPGAVVSEAEAVNTMNAAFLIQQLMMSGQGEVGTAMQVSAYLGLSQMGTGLVSDGVKLTSLVNSALSPELRLGSRVLTTLGRVGAAADGGGGLLGIGSLIAMGIQLEQTTDPVARAELISQIVSDDGVYGSGAGGLGGRHAWRWRGQYFFGGAGGAIGRDRDWGTGNCFQY